MYLTELNVVNPEESFLQRTDKKARDDGGDEVSSRRLYVVFSSDAQFLEFGIEGGSLHTDSSGSAVRPSDLSCLTQNPQNVFTLIRL